MSPDITISYWDWTDPNQQSFPAWVAAFTETVRTPDQGDIPVERFPGDSGYLAQVVQVIPQILKLSNYSDFTEQLEHVHNFVHNWVGGAMAAIPTAPADPIFWMHHTNVDRLWWQLQQSPAGQGKHPNLSGKDAVLEPWRYREEDVRDIQQLGYRYV